MAADTETFRMASWINEAANRAPFVGSAAAELANEAASVGGHP
jgi:hypothetical protein